MMLGVVVAQVSDAWLPVDEELTLACVIAYPIKAHVDLFRSFLFDGVVGKAFGGRIVNLDWSRLHQWPRSILIRTLLLKLDHPHYLIRRSSDLSGSQVRFYWIHDHTSQGQFIIYWQPGITYLGNYHTKHHSPAHQQLMRPTYLHTSEQ